MNINKQLERKYNVVFPLYRKETDNKNVIKLRTPIDKSMPKNEWNTTNTIEMSIKRFDGSGTPEDMADTAILYDELIEALSLENNPNDVNRHAQ